jgi:hypothetical protein
LDPSKFPREVGTQAYIGRASKPAFGVGLEIVTVERRPNVGGESDYQGDFVVLTMRMVIRRCY